MKLYNTRTKTIEEFTPLEGNTVRLYSCGPTVYDHAHIGNLSSFIAADSLKRALRAAGYDVEHVMNITDIDDKMIARSREKYPDLDPHTALKTLARDYEERFKQDMKAIGNDIEDIEFVRATESIPEIQVLIGKLYEDGFAYLADDGVYFSIDAYRKSGKVYGQLKHIDSSTTSHARVANDEYDKDSVHDFALWKTAKPGEPVWEFSLGGQKLDGRPGWHIECSVMSTMKLSQPFDIHTGGIDLIFPHHENEIAQSTAGRDDPIYANLFAHSEHLLIDGKKMSKSLNNFYTLSDISAKGFDPLAFRLMILQSHYRKQANFTFEGLQAAQNRLNELRNWAALRWQAKNADTGTDYSQISTFVDKHLTDDLNTPQALASFSGSVSEDEVVANVSADALRAFVSEIDDNFGLDLSQQADLTPDQKQLLSDRAAARDNKDWTLSDQLRDNLLAQGIAVKDTAQGQVWSRTSSH